MATLAPVLARKLKKVLETRTDSPDLLASLAVLSTFYNENTLQARRDLRTTMEKRGLSINEEFLQASEAAQKALDSVEAEVEGLSACCERIVDSLSSCSAWTGHMVAATERLRKELESTTGRQEQVLNFLHNYQLTPEEVNALREEELDEGFFKALSRVQDIHANCKVLLRTHHQRAGLELMDVMAVYQEGAYERLCRWVQAECRSLGDNDTPEVSDLLKTAARSLRERPVLFKYCAEEVANTRHNALFRRFISALTRGGPGGMPRPIEVHAHDPLRYVGDMLAWLHQALASEREVASALFSREVSSDRSMSRRFSMERSNVESQVESTDMVSVLDRVFEGVCRPFKVRVEQVLTSQPGLILAYKLSNLLEFYAHTIGELLGENAALMVTVKDVRDAAVRTFYDIMKTRGEKLVKYPPPLAADLSPPPAVAETVSLVLELLETHKTAMVPAGAPRQDFEPVLSALLDPVQHMCERAAESYGSKTLVSPLQRSASGSLDDVSSRRLSSGGGGGPEGTQRANSTDSGAGLGLSRWPNVLNQAALETVRQIFLINCFSMIEQPLLPYDVAAVRVRALRTIVEGHISSLVNNEVIGILERCSLASKVEVVQERMRDKASGNSRRERLCDIEEMSGAEVAESMRSLFTLLVADGALPEFVHMQLPRLRAEACNKVASALANAYEIVYNAVLDADNGYVAAGTMLRHTPSQLRTILGI